MKTFLIISLTNLIVFGICGCSKKKPEVELTKDNISKLETSVLTKVCILCFSSKMDPNWKQMPYSYELSIEPTKGSVILRCIIDANQTEFDRERFSKKRTGKMGNSGLFVFETNKTIYSTRIGWNDKLAYGFWWESADLLSIFRGWGLFEDLSKSDPNWPPPVWFKNPPRGRDPNSYYRLRNGVYQRGRDINDNSLKKEAETN